MPPRPSCDSTTLGPSPTMASDAQLAKMDKPTLAVYLRGCIADIVRIDSEYRALLALCVQSGAGEDVAAAIAAHVAGAVRDGG